MTTQTAATHRPIVTLHEKRKFNWLVLGLLLTIIAIGAAWLLM